MVGGYTIDAGDQPPGTDILVTRDDVTGVSHTQLLPQPTSDPNDPLNWSKGRKTYNFTLTLAASAIIFTALTIQNVMWQQMVVDLKTGYTALINTGAMQFAGLAAGCFALIPIAIKFGRRPVYLGSLVVMLGMAILNAEATDMEMVNVANFFLGFAGPTNETIVEMTIADLYFVHQRARANAMYMVMVMIGSFLSPVIAGYIASAKGWRFCWWIQAVFYGVIFLVFLISFEETKYNLPQLGGLTPAQTASPSQGIAMAPKKGGSAKADPVATEERHDLDRTTTSHEHIDQSIPPDTLRRRLRFWSPSPEPMVPLYTRPLRILFTFPGVLFTGLQYSFGLCWITVIMNTIALVMPAPPYSFSPSGIGLMGIGPFIGCIIGSLYGGLLGDWSVLKLAKRNRGLYEPEMRLHLLHFPVFVMSGGILMFGLTIAKSMHWIYPSVGGALFGFGLGCIGDTSITYTLDCYRNIAGESFTGIAFLRNIFSIVLTFAMSPWIKSQGLRDMFIVDTVWSLAISLLYIVMLIWGKKFRRLTAPKYMKYVQARGDSRG